MTIHTYIYTLRQKITASRYNSQNYRANGHVIGRRCNGILKACGRHDKELGNLKAALYTIVPRSPKYCVLQKRYKMRMNACFNEMALFGPFAALIKESL